MPDWKSRTRLNALPLKEATMFRRIILLATIVFVVFGHSGATPLHAETSATTFTVNSAVDEPDANKTDEACISTPSGKCTLRAAAMQANASSDANTIVLQNATMYVLTIGGADENSAATGDLDLVYDVNIVGAGPNRSIINGNDIDRVFHVTNSAARVHLSEMTIRNGNVSGIAGENGGGILNTGGLVLQSVLVSENVAISDGGGIFNLGGNVVMADSTFSANVAENGGGIYNAPDGTVTIWRSTFSGNHVEEDGGAIMNHGGIVTLINSTVSGNWANRDGGGIETHELNNPISGVKLYNVTLVLNRSDADDDGVGEGGGINQQTGLVWMKNTILARNTKGTIAATPYDCFGYITSLGYNLIQTDPLNCLIVDDNATNKKGLDPKLGSLANNGGLTRTHAPLIASPVIDAGNPNGCKDQYNGTLSNDQRSEPRTVNGDGVDTSRCDIGAFEFNPVIAPPPVLCAGKPSAPALTSPLDNAQSSAQKVQLQWNDTTCATKYKVMVRQDGQHGPKADGKKVNVSEYKTKALAKGHAYFWNVKACNTFGCTKSEWRKVMVP